jgi:hypothetical protein
MEPLSLEHRLLPIVSISTVSTCCLVLESDLIMICSGSIIELRCQPQEPSYSTHLSFASESMQFRGITLRAYSKAQAFDKIQTHADALYALNLSELLPLTATLTRYSTRS